MTGNPKGHPVSWDEFDHLFAGFHHTAFRLETRQSYASPEEQEEFGDFLDFKEFWISLDLKEWLTEIQAGVATGRRYDRVHVVTEPLSDYVRFECAWGYRNNVAAGENVRILPVQEGDWPEGLPHLDYWLFDSRHLVVMNYAKDGSLVNTELVEDPKWIVAANAWRDHAMQRSIPFPEYETRFDTYMHPF